VNLISRISPKTDGSPFRNSRIMRIYLGVRYTLEAEIHKNVGLFALLWNLNWICNNSVFSLSFVMHMNSKTSSCWEVGIWSVSKKSSDVGCSVQFWAMCLCKEQHVAITYVSSTVPWSSSWQPHKEVNLEGRHFVLTSGNTKVGLSMSELIWSAKMLQCALLLEMRHGPYREQFCVVCCSCSCP